MQNYSKWRLPGDQEALAKEPSLIPGLSLSAPSLCGYVLCVPTTCAARLTSMEARGRYLDLSLRVPEGQGHPDLV